MGVLEEEIGGLAFHRFLVQNFALPPISCSFLAPSRIDDPDLSWIIFFFSRRRFQGAAFFVSYSSGLQSRVYTALH